MYFYQKQQGVHRSIASIKLYRPHGLMIGKQAAAMTVEIVGPESYPDDNTEIVELVGYVTQHLSAESWVEYEWVLPEDVELVRGPLSNNLGNLKMGSPYQVSILVKGFSREKQKLIVLKSHLLNTQNPLMASAVVVSRPEDTMESKVMNVRPSF